MDYPYTISAVRIQFSVKKNKIQHPFFSQMPPWDYIAVSHLRSSTFLSGKWNGPVSGNRVGCRRCLEMEGTEGRYLIRFHINILPSTPLQIWQEKININLDSFSCQVNMERSATRLTARWRRPDDVYSRIVYIGHVYSEGLFLFKVLLMLTLIADVWRLHPKRICCLHQPTRFYF